MEVENAVLQVRQGSLADQTKVGGEFFVFAAPGASALAAGDEVERDLAHVLLARGVLAKALKTRSKNGSENAVKGMRAFVSANSKAQTDTGITPGGSQR